MKNMKTRTQLETENERLRSENKKLRRRLGEEDYIGSKFVGSKRKKKKVRLFHRPNCKWAAYLTPTNTQGFDSHEEAVGAGYKPCKTCRA